MLQVKCHVSDNCGHLKENNYLKCKFSLKFQYIKKKYKENKK